MPSLHSPIITLLTDFGSTDHFAGVLHGVIAGIAPDARVVDLTHQVPPFQVAQARFLLGQSWPWFPKGTVHLVVVDPGVGSERRPLLVEVGGHRFVGPDNGLFTELVDADKAVVRHLDKSKYWLKNVSQTFHARDVFAPVAAHLAKGSRPAAMGTRIEDALRAGSLAPQRAGRRLWIGSVLHVDRFGNLITNLAASEFPGLGERLFELRVGLRRLHRLAAHYDAGTEGEPIVLAGSTGFLEVSVRQDSAARVLGCGVATPVELELS